MSLFGAIADPRFRDDVSHNLGLFGQSMSKSVAEGFTAPVDGLAWLLRKGGLNIPKNHVGGSDWAKQMGLMVDVPHGAPKMAGEMMGLLAPMAGTKQGANAIATALRQGGENLSKARTINPQTGAIVWHGSPHKFDKFDASKIGTGEGAQAYGHGLYLAESPDVAKNYAENLALRAPQQTRAQILSEIKRVKDNVQGFRRSQLLKQLNDDLAFIKSGAGAEGQLYKVDLPDEQIARMLDWEMPLSQQSDAIQKIARSADIKTASGSKASGIIKAWREGRDVGVTAKGGDLHQAMTNFGNTDPGAFSELLRSQGIPGVRYLDEGSRNTGKGTSNFVVFPGNENMLKILERNGQPLGLLGDMNRPGRYTGEKIVSGMPENISHAWKPSNWDSLSLPEQSALGRAQAEKEYRLKNKDLRQVSSSAHEMRKAYEEIYGKIK